MKIVLQSKEEEEEEGIPIGSKSIMIVIIIIKIIINGQIRFNFYLMFGNNILVVFSEILKKNQ